MWESWGTTWEAWGGALLLAVHWAKHWGLERMGVAEKE